MDISVVVPVYNSEEYVEACIDALLSQNYPKDKYEIIYSSLHPFWEQSAK